MPDTAPSPLAELVDLERFTGCTSAEIAAAKTDLHMSTCRDPIWGCEQCASFLKVIRRIIAAVGPVLAGPAPSAEPVAVENKDRNEEEPGWA